MRGLNLEDCFKFGRFIKKIGMEEEYNTVKDIALQAMKNGENLDLESMGFDLVIRVAGKVLEEAGENMVYELLSGILEKSVEDTRKTGLFELIEELQSWRRQYMSNDTAKAFFTAVSRWIQLK